MDVTMDEEKNQYELPYDILNYIFQKLKLREATISNLVSKDWRNALLHSIVDLDFDASWKFSHSMCEDDVHWYVSWVNEVIKSSLCAKLINSFRVNFALNKIWVHDIDRWLGFAFQRKVKSLQFDLSYDGYFLHPNSSNLYPFPDIFDPFQRLRIFPSHVNIYSSISNLQCLSLVSVQINSQTIEFFLSNCPLLEQLCIKESRELTNLRISGSNLPLKYLQIYNSFLTRSFEIDAPNLLSFECDYSLYQVKINIVNIEKLIKLTIPCTSFLGNFCQYTPQLEELVIINQFCPSRVLNSYKGVELLKLRRAELIIQKYNSAEIIISLISNLLNGAPYLEIFKIDTGLYYYDQNMESGMYDVPICHQHSFLKFVEIRGSIRDDYITAARLLSRIAISIKMMVLGLPLSINDYPKETICNMKKAIKQLVHELELKLPSRIQFDC